MGISSRAAVAPISGAYRAAVDRPPPPSETSLIGKRYKRMKRKADIRFRRNWSRLAISA
jgi:hypothetical protein